MYEDPLQMPGDIGERAGKRSGILDEGWSGTPLLYVHIRLDIREYEDRSRCFGLCI